MNDWLSVALYKDGYSHKLTVVLDAGLEPELTCRNILLINDN